MSIERKLDTVTVASENDPDAGLLRCSSPHHQHSNPRASNPSSHPAVLDPIYLTRGEIWLKKAQTRLRLLFHMQQVTRVPLTEIPRKSFVCTCTSSIIYMPCPDMKLPGLYIWRGCCTVFFFSRGIYARCRDRELTFAYMMRSWPRNCQQLWELETQQFTTFLFSPLIFFFQTAFYTGLVWFFLFQVLFFAITLFLCSLYRQMSKFLV